MSRVQDKVKLEARANKLSFVRNMEGRGTKFGGQVQLLLINVGQRRGFHPPN